MVSMETASQPKITVETYTLTARNGRHIRKATKVVFPDGYEIKFTEHLSKREALRQVAQVPVR